VAAFEINLLPIIKDKYHYVKDNVPR
jgi:hypothetical protein